MLASAVLTAVIGFHVAVHTSVGVQHSRGPVPLRLQIGRGDADEVRQAAAREAAERSPSQDLVEDIGEDEGWADWSSVDDVDGVGAPSWATDDDSGMQDTAWMSPAVPVPDKPRKPIEAVKIGRVSGPYTRRNGYHVDVRVQHPGSDIGETKHTLWISHQVLDETSILRGKHEHDISVAEFSETIVAFLGGSDGGVDLSDPDWEIDNGDIPFSSQHFSVRTLFNYYPQLKEHLAEKLFGPDTGAKRPPAFKNMAMGSHPLSGW